MISDGDWTVAMPTPDLGIHLDINRTSASNRCCAFPSCKSSINLKHLRMEARCKLLKDENIYVPQNSKICARHLNVSWSEVIFETKLPFTTHQIQDMIDLLRNHTTDEQRNSNEEGENNVNSVYFSLS